MPIGAPSNIIGVIVEELYPDIQFLVETKRFEIQHNKGMVLEREKTLDSTNKWCEKERHQMQQKSSINHGARKREREDIWRSWNMVDRGHVCNFFCTCLTPSQAWVYIGLRFFNKVWMRLGQGRPVPN